MIGDGAYVEFARNTFSGSGRSFASASVYVHPHSVSSYRRGDGALVSGFRRDGHSKNGGNMSGFFRMGPGSGFNLLK